MSSAGRSVSPCFQYSVQSLRRDRFRFISPYTTTRLDKRQKIFFHTDIVLHSANTFEIQATKKPHNYHKIAVWQKDDRIRKSPLKFCVYYYSELEGDCQASIITELWRLSVVFVCCFLCYFMAHDSRKVRHTFLFQRTDILVHALYRMADIVLRYLRRYPGDIPGQNCKRLPGVSCHETGPYCRRTFGTAICGHPIPGCPPVRYPPAAGGWRQMGLFTVRSMPKCRRE